MTSVATHPRVEPYSLPLHQFSMADYLKLIGAGILGRLTKVELIDGVVVSKWDDGRGPRVEPLSLPLHQFSTADYLRMIDLGVLGASDRVELIDGIIVEMSPAGSRHNSVLLRLNRLFAPAMAHAEVAVQGTLILREGRVFDPDFMLLRLKPDTYRSALPGAEDVLLLIEVSDSSLRHDCQIKLPIYATAGIGEYWIADLDSETLIVHREPQANSYASTRTLRGDEAIAPLTLPDLSLKPRDIFA